MNMMEYIRNASSFTFGRRKTLSSGRVYPMRARGDYRYASDGAVYQVQPCGAWRRVDCNRAEQRRQVRVRN